MPLSETEQRVCAHISARAGELLEDLCLHVSLPTGGRNTAALDTARNLLTGRAAVLGATCQLVPGQARPTWLYGELPDQPPLPAAVCRRPDSGRELLIAGHLDTVHDPHGTFKELSISRDGKTATGPGCVDMKGGLVIALAALESLHACGVDCAWTLLLNSDEETGSYHSFHAILNEASRVHSAGGVGIALEPAAPGGALVVERSGSAQFRFEAIGRAAHVGRDFAAGVNAVERLCHAIIAAQQLSSPATGLIVNIGPIRGGTATNVVPDIAHAWGNVRFSTHETAVQAERALADIASRVSSGAAPGTPGSVTVTMNIGRPAKPLTTGTQRLAELALGAATDLQQPLPFAKTAGVCDGNIMQHAGLPTIDTLGVRGGGLHTPDEWIELDSLVERCQLLATFMIRASRAGA